MSAKSGRILALDVGTKRVGVAFSDPLGLSAQPGPTLARRPSAPFYERLASLIAEKEIETVVVGLPIGQEGQRSGISHEAVQALLLECRKRFPEVEWTTCDERYTSIEASEILLAAPKKRRAEKGLRDQIAAQLILERYLHERPPSKEQP
ncbi:MAG: Holliday junction resolvase RuvX [Candidatus Omnitrophica bacterium]|nr:putative pre-16S rRNA nuclease [bacterium]NUN95374.1 Holliday junction resolvase RuvX [Candidatus Omnitrophota bacterium]